MNSFVQTMRSARCAVWFFPSRHHRRCSSLLAAGRQQICKTVQVSEGGGIFPGKEKKKKPNEKIVRVEEVINQNIWICFYLLITRCSGSQTGLSRLPKLSSDRRRKRGASQSSIGLLVPPCSTLRADSASESLIGLGCAASQSCRRQKSHN